MFDYEKILTALAMLGALFLIIAPCWILYSRWQKWQKNIEVLKKKAGRQL